MRLLNNQNIPHYLLEKGLLSAQDIVQNDFMMQAVKSRNQLFKVYRKKGTPLLIKQVGDGQVSSRYLLNKEAYCYQLLRQSTDFQALKTDIPEFIHYDARNYVLSIAFLPKAKNVFETYANRDFPIEIAQRQAEVLARLHQVPFSPMAHPILRGELPWILNIDHIPPQRYSPENQAAQQAVQLIQSHQEFRKLLQNIRQEWKPKCLMHGDIKWTNFLTWKNENDAIELRLIDWETADYGDPLWDVAGVFQSYISSWVLSFDNQNVQEHQLLQHPMSCDLDKMQPSIQCFWEQYVELHHWTENEAEAQCTKAVRYMAVRLLQTSLEAIAQTPRLLPNNARMLQASFHILKNPAVAIDELLGLSKIAAL